MNLWRDYIKSFDFNKKFWQIFLIDLSFFFSVVILFSSLSLYIPRKYELITGGRSAEQLQQLILNSPEQTVLLVSQIRSFLIIIVLIALLVFVSGFLLFTFTRSVIWHKLNNKKVSRYWFWNLLVLVLFMPIILIAVAGLIIRVIINFLISFALSMNINFYSTHSYVIDTITTALNGIIDFAIIITLLIYVYLVFNSFVNKNKIWTSIGTGFSKLRIYKKKLCKLFVYVLLTSLLLNWIIYYLDSLNEILLTIIKLTVGVFIVNWLRIGVFKTDR